MGEASLGSLKAVPLEQHHITVSDSRKGKLERDGYPIVIERCRPPRHHSKPLNGLGAPSLGSFSFGLFRSLEPTFAHCICIIGRHLGAEMSRYFFDVKNGHRLVDPSGLDCRNDQEAIKNATVIARQIARDAPPTGPRHVSVLNSDREEVSKVPINKEEKEDRSGKL
jgi:hypothetical protein